MTELAFHAIADIFPLMDGQPLADLTDDIKTHGLREPIWLYEGQILDGRNRWRACQAAGVEPVFADYQDDDPVGFVVSLNLHRRHLNESQRAMVGATIANVQNGENQYTRGCANLHTQTNEETAEQLSVSPRSIQIAKTVKRDGVPELNAKVMSGQVRVSTAADIATLPPNEQDIIVSLGEKAILMAAKEIRQKKAIERQEANNRIRQQALTTPPPDGQYRCIVIDPPWPMQKIERDLYPEQTPQLDYPVMTLEDISAVCWDLDVFRQAINLYGLSVKLLTKRRLKAANKTAQEQEIHENRYLNDSRLIVYDRSDFAIAEKIIKKPIIHSSYNLHQLIKPPITAIAQDDLNAPPQIALSFDRDNDTCLQPPATPHDRSHPAGRTG